MRRSSPCHCRQWNGRLCCAQQEVTTCWRAMPASWVRQLRAPWKARRKSSSGDGFHTLSRVYWHGTETPWCCIRIWPSRVLVRRCRPCNASAPDYNLIPAAVGRAATGNLVLALMPLSVDPPSAMQYANCVSAFRGMLPAGSSAEVAHCPNGSQAHFDVWGTTPTDVNMMRAVKRAIDPKNILNRGRFIV